MAALLLFCCTSPCRAQDRLTGVNISSFVHFSCGSWAAERKIGGFGEKQFEAWVDGYMSGHAQESGVNFLQITDAEGVYAALDAECLKTPLDTIESASVRVIQQLVARMPK
jgi:hypothetical protein